MARAIHPHYDARNARVLPPGTPVTPVVRRVVALPGAAR